MNLDEPQSWGRYLGFIAQLCFELFKYLNDLDKQV